MPLMIAFFTWEVRRECIFTFDKLMKKGHIMVNGCYLCMNAAESGNHLLLWCLVTYSSRNIVYNLLDINWVIESLIKNELWAWDGIRSISKFVKLIPLSIFFLGCLERDEQ